MNVNLNNYEEYLLSYVDGELSEQEAAAVRRFLQAHPDKQKELDLLQMTVLPGEEAVGFPDKGLLYRQEKPPGKKVFFLRKYTWPAAAACVALIAFFYLQPSRNSSPVGGTVALNGSSSLSGPAADAESPPGDTPGIAGVPAGEGSPKPAIAPAAPGHQGAGRAPERLAEAAAAPSGSGRRRPETKRTETQELAADLAKPDLPVLPSPPMPVKGLPETREAIMAVSLPVKPGAGGISETAAYPENTGAGEAGTGRNAKGLESLAVVKQDFDSTVTQTLTDINRKASGFINNLAKNGVKIGHITFAINN